MNFVAIDFETANTAAYSACSVGLVRCVNGKFTEEFQTLIRPPRLWFRPDFIDIHGITPSDVRGCAAFDAQWDAIHAFIGDALLVAHNAPFDRSVLNGCLEYYNLPPISNPWKCTCQAARSFFPKVLCHPLANYRLNTIADYYNIHFQHHDALEDARTCALILENMAQNPHFKL